MGEALKFDLISGAASCLNIELGCLLWASEKAQGNGHSAALSTMSSPNPESNFSIQLSFTSQDSTQNAPETAIFTANSTSADLSSFIESIESNVDNLVNIMEKTNEMGRNSDESVQKRGIKRKTEDRSP